MIKQSLKLLFITDIYFLRRTRWRPRACREWGGLGTSHTLWRRRACREWGWPAPHIPCGGAERVESGAVSAPHIPCGSAERVESGADLHRTYPVEAQSVSRMGRSRHLTYPVEAQSVSRVGLTCTAHTLWRRRAFREWGWPAPHIPCGGSERVESGADLHRTYPVEALSVSRVGRSRHLTYPVEAQSVSRVGLTCTAHTLWRRRACREWGWPEPHIPCGGSERVESGADLHRTYPVEAQSVSRVGRSRHLTYPVEAQSVSRVGLTCTAHTLWRRRACREWGWPAPHIPCGGSERVESGADLHRTYPVEALSVSRVGRSRHLTYPVEAQSVSRVGLTCTAHTLWRRRACREWGWPAPHIPCGGSERVESGADLHRTYPVEAQSVSRVGRSRHLTYPVEAQSVSRVGLTCTAHTLWRRRACREWGWPAPHIPCGGSERVESGAVSAPHIPCGSAERVESGADLHRTYPVEDQSVSRVGRSRHLTYPVEAQSVSRVGLTCTAHTLWRRRACREWGGLGTSHTLWRRRACREWGWPAPHIPCGGAERVENGAVSAPHIPCGSAERVESGAVSAPHIPCGSAERVESGADLHRTYPVEDQSVSRVGRSRHLTYPVEAQSVSRVGLTCTAHTLWRRRACREWGWPAPHIPCGGAERVESGADLHRTYPVEAQSVSRVGLTCTAHTLWRCRACREWGWPAPHIPCGGSERVESGAVSAPHIPCGGAERVESGAVSAPHIPCGGAERVESGADLHRTYSVEAQSVSRVGLTCTAHTLWRIRACREWGGLGTSHTLWRRRACRECVMSAPHIPGPDLLGNTLLFLFIVTHFHFYIAFQEITFSLLVCFFCRFFV